MTPVVVFTDLDGTLLDHFTYDFAPARPALRALRAHGIPLVLATSKTLVEAAELNRRLDNFQAVIVENGAAAGLPPALAGSLPPAPAGAFVHGYRVVRYAPPYAELRRFIDDQRAAHGYRLEGFGDMRREQVMHHTGLDATAAARAMQRLCSEPFLWHDSDARLSAFVAAAEAAGLRVTRGGRFHHLIGTASKAGAIARLRPLLADAGPEPGTSVVLGDSDNDREMLEQADIAVVVRRHDGTHLDCRGRRRTLYTEAPGPAGWNAAVLQLLDQSG